MLSIEKIETYYGDSYVLQGISLRVPEKAVIGLLGRNGVGKTTLIRSIIGFTPPRKGRILFKGTDITNAPPERISKLGIGLVPQGRRIFRSLTVYENLLVAETPRPSGIWNVESTFELFPRLRERSSHYAGKLSGGEQGMLAIARSLVGNPDLILMDEPTEGLAPLLIENLASVLNRLKEKGLSILLVEQNLNFTLDLAGYIYLMTKGEIVFQTSSEEFQGNEEAKHLYLGI